MKNKSILVIVAIIIIAVIAVIFGGGKQPSDRVVKVGYLPLLIGTSHFIALEEGYYEEEGVKVEAILFESSNQLQDALVRGDIDITPNSSALPVLITQIKDPGKVKVFSFSRYSAEKPIDQIVVKNNSDIVNLTDLQNKKIGVFPGSTATAFLKDYLTKNSVNISNITFVQLPAKDHITGLESGSVDAIYGYEPNIALAKVKIGGRTIGGSALAYSIENNPLGVGVISSDFIKKDPDLAKKMISIYDRTYDFIYVNDQKTRKIIAENMNMQSDVVSVANLVYHSKSTELDISHFQKLVDILISFKELPSQPDLSTLFYK